MGVLVQAVSKAAISHAMAYISGLSFSRIIQRPWWDVLSAMDYGWNGFKCANDSNKDDSQIAPPNPPPFYAFWAVGCGESTAFGSPPIFKSGKIP